ncbi:MAG: hypothetical protein Q7U56_13100 [Humidesulfovibrio sp.]|nr:hypothetical protein [Humidesulfovibrio sp.]
MGTKNSTDVGSGATDNQGAGNTPVASEEAAKTDARIAELERSLAKANENATVVDQLQRQLAELTAQMAEMTRSVQAGPEGPTAEEARSEAETLQTVINDKRVKVIIATEEGDAGKKPVPVLVNGHMVFIPRGIEAVIPECAYKALLNAAETRWETDDSGRPGQSSTMPRFNITFLGPVEKGEE